MLDYLFREGLLASAVEHYHSPNLVLHLDRERCQAERYPLVLLETFFYARTRYTNELNTSSLRPHPPFPIHGSEKYGHDSSA